MSDSNRTAVPAGDDTLPVDFEASVDAISDVLGPVDEEPKVEENQSEQDADEPDEVEAETEGDEPKEEAETEEGDDADADDDDTEADDEEETEDGPLDGFAADDHKVTMADGQTITVAELRTHADERIKDMQRTFTQRTQEASERVKQVDEAAQTLSEHRDYLVQWLQATTPQPPDPSMLDPNSENFDIVGHAQQKNWYEQVTAAQAEMRQQMQWDNQRKAQEEQQAEIDRMKERDEAFMELMPEMRTPKNLQAFADDIKTIGNEAYGITPEEVNEAVKTGVGFQILKDALEYRKLKAKAPETRKKVEGKPKMLKGGKRSNPKSKAANSVKQRSDRLAKTGTVEAGIASLIDLDL